MYRITVQSLSALLTSVLFMILWRECFIVLVESFKASWQPLCEKPVRFLKTKEPVYPFFSNLLLMRPINFKRLPLMSTILKSFKISSWEQILSVGCFFLFLLKVLTSLHCCVCVCTVLWAESVCACMVRQTRGGSWQGYRGNTVCVGCVDELLPFPAIYPGDGCVVNYGSWTQRCCKRFHPWPWQWGHRWGRGEKTSPQTNSSVIYVQTVCSHSNYHSAGSSQGALEA